MKLLLNREFLFTFDKKMPNPFKDPDVAARYDSFYEEKVGKIYDELEKRAILKLMEGLKIESLLEVGSGTGHWSQFFAERGIHVVGIDNSPAVIDIARKKHIANAIFLLADAENMNLDRKFDAAAFITSLEFMDDPERALRNSIKFIKKKGYILVGVLNEDSFLGKKRKQGKTIYTDAHFYKQEELEQLLSPFGKVSIIQCAFAAPSEIDRGFEIERMAREKGRRDGNFIAARVDLD